MQVADVPGRNEPGTGEIGWEFLFGRIEALGYRGWIGCEYRPEGETTAGLAWRRRFGIEEGPTMNALPAIDPQALLAFAAAVYEEAGMPAEDARLAADTLVQADLWGHQSHGVLRLSWYVGAAARRGDASR